MGKDSDVILSKSALITGISGFVGTHLAQTLAGGAWRVNGFDKTSPIFKVDGFYQGQLSDRAVLSAAIHETKPDVVFHLAGVLKANQIETFYSSYVLGTVELFEAILKAGVKPLVIIASSSAVYGSGHGMHPITEKSALRPFSHYAVSKAAQEMVALRYSLAHKLPVIRIRTFNLLGAGLSVKMACSAFASQIARAEQKQGDHVVAAGNLSACRDFVDVRDAVRAYNIIAEDGKAGAIYNVCSEHAVSMRKCLSILIGMSKVDLETVFDPQRAQENDASIQVGSAKKLKHDTGWRAQISLKQSLADLLNDWRQRIRSERS
jgi:GDP-4-dehydro-6-deoxy-D-mannose reductase